MKEVFKIGERTGSSSDLKEQSFYQFSRSLEKKKKNVLFN